MKKEIYLHIKVKAGRIGLDRFRQIIKTLVRFQITKIAIGEQQTLYFETTKENKEQVIKAIETLNFRFQTEGNFNLVSSIPALDIVPSTAWLHSGVYSKISQSFPKVKPLSVRLTDPAQRLVSLFGSKINFVASEFMNFWYLFIRLADGNYFLWPVMVNSNSVGDAYKILCAILIENPSIEKKKLINLFNEKGSSISTRSFLTEPKIDSMEFPYFDGLHYTGKDYWFGFSGAKGYFKTHELDAFCVLLEQIKTKEIYLNLRGGVILKNIQSSDVSLLNQSIKQSSFKTGRAFNELGWQYDALNPKEYSLKERFSNQLSLRGNENYGFSVKLIHKNRLDLTKQDTDYVISYTSIVPKIWFLDQFQLWIKQSNNPAHGIYRAIGNTQSLGQVAENIYTKLLASTKFQPEIDKNIQQKEKEEQTNKTEEFSCVECDTVYNPENGDINQGVLPGTSYELLPNDYSCFVCGAEKKQFKKQ